MRLVCVNSWPRMSGIFSTSRWATTIRRAREKVYDVVLYFFSYYSCWKLHFAIILCTVKLSIELNTFRIDDEDLNTNNIHENEQIFEMNDASVRHQPISVSFLDASPVCCLYDKMLIQHLQSYVFNPASINLPAFQVLASYGFTWDSTINVPPLPVPVWPYSLEYKIPHECRPGTCPTRSFPGEEIGGFYTLSPSLQKYS